MKIINSITLIYLNTNVVIFHFDYQLMLFLSLAAEIYTKIFTINDIYNLTMQKLIDVI